MADLSPDALAAFEKLNAASRAHMEALAKLIALPSRQFKADPMRPDWIDREQAMRLIAPLRDNASTLAVMLREELKRAHGVSVVGSQPSSSHTTEGEK